EKFKGLTSKMKKSEGGAGSASRMKDLKGRISTRFSVNSKKSQPNAEANLYEKIGRNSDKLSDKEKELFGSFNEGLNNTENTPSGSKTSNEEEAGSSPRMNDFQELSDKEKQLFKMIMKNFEDS